MLAAAAAGTAIAPLPAQRTAQRQGQPRKEQHAVDPSHELVILSQARPRSTPLMVGGCTAHCHADYSEFRQSGLNPGAFIVKSEDPLYIRHILRQLRRDPDHATALAF